MKFNDNDMFCVKCGVHDTFWTGGHSWGIDHCPVCGGMETILWKNMTDAQQHNAYKIFSIWWQKERMQTKEN
jgi:hypothetical protein